MPQTQLGTAERLLEELAGWVRHETPSNDAGAVNALLDVAERGLAAAGARLERLPGRDGFGDTLIARTPGEGPPVVVAGHLDTVWDHGMLAGPMPYRVDGDRAFGPGIFDMKAGSFLAFHCVREIVRQRTATQRPIVLLLTPDEEVGSPTSRAPIEAAARGAAAVLIPEPAGGPDGRCVTERKGTGMFKASIEGVSAHAGGNWTEGRSAVVALSRLVLAVHALTDLGRGVTTNVAPIWGGTRSNVIPPEAGCRIDFRAPSIAAAEQVVAAVHGIAAELSTDGIRVTVTGGLNRPPFPETPAGLALFERARALAAAAGYTLDKQSRGGGSDGNFTAVMGVPTLDGLGCPGAGAHAPDEHIRWRELAPRAQVLCGLLETL